MARHGRLVTHGPIYDKGSSSRHSNSSRILQLSQLPQLPTVLLLLITVWAALGTGYIAWRLTRSGKPQLPEYMFEPVLISYSYFEKDALQVRATGTFIGMLAGMGSSDRLLE